ncbi:hypothetical protein [Actinomadura rupiterrae]|uniref:hypothetical protein n=1 Tax=Actinomadura rupiterrae TaxID=559627 RepID=UPI0020A294F1|nr:hypothetical protein [Actinomadura rupiterrae]MCP2342930.1 hypothetical protein [Actinomadura rupiterrae]
MNRKINRSRYLTPPAVWGDDRPLGAREVTRPTDQVNLGDLIVFRDDHGNAYRVGGIDRLNEHADQDLNRRATICFTCGNGTSRTFPNPAAFREGDPVTVLEIPHLTWDRSGDIARLYVDGTYAGFLARNQATPDRLWEVHYWDDYLERHCHLGECPQQWLAERLLTAFALGLNPDDDYRVTLPSGRTVNLTVIDRPTLDALPTLAVGDHGDELKVDTGRIQVWMAHGPRSWDLPGQDEFQLTDAIYMRERPDQNIDRWDTTSVWK